MMSSKWMKTVAASALLAAAVAVSPHPAAAGTIDPGLEKALGSAGPDERVPVIVRFTGGPDLDELKKEKDVSKRKTEMITALKDAARENQAQARAFLESRGVKEFKELWLINGMALDLPAAAVDGLSRQHGVESIGLDGTLAAPEPSYGELAAPEWNIDAVRAPGLWSQGYLGTGVVVANMDTGVDAAHQDLSGTWRGGGNSWFDPYGEHAGPFDMNGHGTQAMGLLAGGSSGGTAIGVAPGAEWIAVKIFNDSGTAYFSSIHQGFQWVLDPDGDPATDDSADVVSNSWGIGGPGDCNAEFATDVAALKAADIYVAFAGGNYGPDSMTGVSPANNNGGFGVGSVDSSLTVDVSSSRGPACDGGVFPEVSAPGVNVKTADLTYGGLFPDTYAVVSGTSYSVAHAAGVAALLRGAFSASTVESLEAAITQSALDRGTQGVDNDYGHGVVDATAAYDMLSGSAGTDGDGDGYTYANDCDDADPSVYPGADEVKHDGVDQDCNGYDLTIDITAATYNEKRDVLGVEATSGLGGSAALDLAGYGPMSWDDRKALWKASVKGSGANPGTVVVSGPEGSETSAVTVESGSGGSGGGKNKGR